MISFKGVEAFPAWEPSLNPLAFSLLSTPLLEFRRWLIALSIPAVRPQGRHLVPTAGTGFAGRAGLQRRAGLAAAASRLQRILAELPCTAEVIFVNDGSRDRSAICWPRRPRQDARIKVIGFSRNFGHQVAITAGTDFAAGDVVVVMDADLQDPPELVGR